MAMASLGDASDGPGSPADRARSPSGHEGSWAARKLLGELSEGGCHALAIRYTIELPPGGEHFPKGVDTALAEGFAVSEKFPDERCKYRNGSRNSLHKGTRTTQGQGKDPVGPRMSPLRR